MQQLDDSVRYRIEEYHEKAPDTGCWVWQRARHDQGYGQLSVNGTQRYAHRISYRIHNGPIPEDKQVNHKCDNEPCINPDHLYVGTQEENLQDAREAGWDAGPFGEKHGISKLTEEDVIEIRELYENTDITQRELGRRYGVSHSTIGPILRRETWDHVGGEDAW